MKPNRRDLLKIALGLSAAPWVLNFKARRASPYTKLVKITAIETAGAGQSWRRLPGLRLKPMQDSTVLASSAFPLRPSAELSKPSKAMLLARSSRDKTAFLR